MAPNYSSPNISSDSLCNLAVETCAQVAASRFQNQDLLIRAIVYFLEAIEKDERNYRAHLGLGILLMGGELYYEAIQHFKHAYEINANHEVVEYIRIAENAQESSRLSKVESVRAKKKTTVTDLLDMSDKFKF